MFGKFQKPKIQSQLELAIERLPEPDRNHHKGGRSFYFFDFDENVAYLTTPTYLFHKDSGQELVVTSREFVDHSSHIGVQGKFRDFKIDFCDRRGTFRDFRDKDLSYLERLFGKKQRFEQDLLQALGLPEYHWQGPSWHCFYHAVFNQRPLALITARGHHPQTLVKGIRHFVNRGHLPHEPNYLGIYPVSHPEIQQRLSLLKSSLQQEISIPELKRAALRDAVRAALDKYGYNEHHRFGMSDDDPKNIVWIKHEMAELKKQYPENSFFVIETHQGQFIKHEIFADYSVDQVMYPRQLELLSLE